MLSAAAKARCSWSDFNAADLALLTASWLGAPAVAAAAAAAVTARGTLVRYALEARNASYAVETGDGRLGAAANAASAAFVPAIRAANRVALVLAAAAAA